MHHIKYLPTQFLSAREVGSIIRSKGLETVLRGMAQYLHSDFLRWNDFSMSARLANHSALGVVELMPISDATRYAFKYVNGHPGNTALGLPTVMAFGVLADVATGLPELLCELTLTTALRTAVTSAVAARELARVDSDCMALIGNGAQSEFQALAFRHLLGISKLRLFDTDPAASVKLMRNLRTSGLQLTLCASAAEAVHGADIVTTATADKTRACILDAGMIGRGVHVNAVGGDCPGKTELAPDLLRAASVFVEYEPQTRIEGDLQQMAPDFAVTELWQVLAGQAPGRVGPDQITVFDSVGFALEDFSALRYMRDCALELGLLQPLQLIPALADPKDLFALIEPAAPSRQDRTKARPARQRTALA